MDPNHIFDILETSQNVIKLLALDPVVIAEILWKIQEHANSKFGDISFVYLPNLEIMFENFGKGGVHHNAKLIDRNNLFSR